MPAIIIAGPGSHGLLLKGAAWFDNYHSDWHGEGEGERAGGGEILSNWMKRSAALDATLRWPNQSPCDIMLDSHIVSRIPGGQQLPSPANVCQLLLSLRLLVTCQLLGWFFHSQGCSGITDMKKDGMLSWRVETHGCGGSLKDVSRFPCQAPRGVTDEGPSSSSASSIFLGNRSCTISSHGWQNMKELQITEVRKTWLLFSSPSQNSNAKVQRTSRNVNFSRGNKKCIPESWILPLICWFMTTLSLYTNNWKVSVSRFSLSKQCL